MALFGYAHVPHVIPRQRRIDAAALPGQRALCHGRARLGPVARGGVRDDRF
jgi:oxygen-independent coproporphyrinogen-3 oxidase